ncbi:MAG: T9SS type A sorting domain-containing protein [Bacteroidia bacterium]
MAATLCCCHFFCVSQNRNSVWCFGDSAGIDFSSGIPVTFSSSVDGRGSCVSIADSNGQLLFYAATMRAYASNTEMATFVFDRNHDIMLNGDSIVGRLWYQELVIIPNPANDSTYYLFSISITDTFGIVYSVIDMRLNNGLGAVTVKNVQLQSFEQVDCLNAVKHGNGRDWWLLFRKSDALTFSSNNDWYSYLITPNGIQNLSVQSVGSQNRTGGAHTNFSPDGEKLVFTNWLGLIELYDFDRCTGLLNNPVTIEPDAGMPPYPFTWSCEFSPDESKLYVTASPNTTYLFQYDLNAANISLTKDTLWALTFPNYAGGGLKLASDGKIYLACWYNNGIMFPYPYPDTVYNMYNMNLSVINQPDSLGSACDFQPYSFYLGGKRTYLGLPNNPNYELGAIAGSACDTLTGIAPLATSAKGAELFVTYIASWQKLFVNAQHLKGKSITLTIYDVTGNLIYNTARRLSPSGVGGSAGGYFTQDINCSALAKGMYIVSLQTEKERLVKKFIVE